MFIRLQAMGRLVGATLLALVASAMPARAWIDDQDANRIDDRIEAVHRNGPAAGFEDGDPSKRMLIGMFLGTPIRYAIYVGYDHHPTAADEAGLAALGITTIHTYQYIDYTRSAATYAQIEQIAALPGVIRVEAIPMMYPLNHIGTRVVRARDSRGLAQAENYVLFPSVRQEFGFDGTGVVVGILDTGVNDETDALNTGYPGHEAVKGKFLGGGEFFAGEPALNTPKGQSMNPQDHGAEASSYHATHVAGTAIGTGGNGGYFAGVAPGARLVDCKVLSDAGAGFGSADGVEWCIFNRNTLWPGLAGPDTIYRGIDVLNLSLGCLSCNSDGTDANAQMLNAAVDAGLVVCAASGNGSTQNSISSPASADKCITVGASSHNKTLDRADDTVTSFSNEGPRLSDGDADRLDEMKPNVVAPGAGIISANGDFTSDGSLYQQLSGTSMATPHVAGCAALLLQANPALSPLQVRDILQNTAEHNITSVKGDRPNDPFGVDPNYDRGCGWGLVDMYAAVKEALNSSSGVQVTQIRAVARPADGAVDVTWITQREYPFRGFNLSRAPGVNGAPGTFRKVNTGLIAPAGDPVISGDDNRTTYKLVDTESPKFSLGKAYWYRVEWRDARNIAHLEPPVPVYFGVLPPAATAYYSIVHNAVENDLFIRLGTDDDYDVGPVGEPDFEVLGPSEAMQDSSHVILDPPNAASSTIGNVEHFWSVAFTTADSIGHLLPPSAQHPWFLHVVDGGFINRTGRIPSFSMFVNESPGSTAGTTYVTDHQPMPQPTGELGLTPATLWIPEPGLAVSPLTSSGWAKAARFEAESVPHGIRLTLELATAPEGATATVYRHASPEFERRETVAEAVSFTRSRFLWLDQDAEPGATWWYWVLIRDGSNRTLMSGPVASTALASGPAVTFALPPRPNPSAHRTVLEYAIGRDVAASGPVEVSLTLHDLQGRLVRSLKRAHEGVGHHSVVWDARDEHGQPVARGVYYVKLRAGGMTQTSKIAVVR